MHNDYDISMPHNCCYFDRLLKEHQRSSAPLGNETSKLQLHLSFSEWQCIPPKNNSERCVMVRTLRTCIASIVIGIMSVQWLFTAYSPTVFRIWSHTLA